MVIVVINMDMVGNDGAVPDLDAADTADDRLRIYLIAGWSLEYFVNSITGGMFTSSLSFKEQFDAFQGSWRPLVYGVAFILMTHFIVAEAWKRALKRLPRL